MCVCVYLFLSLLIYFERECVSVCKWEKGRDGGEREKERERIPSRLHTVSTEPGRGFRLRNLKIMS